MKNDNNPGKARRSLKLRKIMKCFCSGEQLQIDDRDESLATKDYTTRLRSSRAREAEQKPDIGDIEEAESSLRESGALNYEVPITKVCPYLSLSLSPYNIAMLSLPLV